MLPTRRTFLARAALGSAAITVPLDALRAAVRRDGLARETPAYGPLMPVADETTGLPLRQLPEGFRYASLFDQERAAGGATFARLEGAWHADGRIYVTSTSGGNAKMGQVWELIIGADQLSLVYESPGMHELNMPDNLTVSPRGGLVLCEDGTANPCVHTLTRDGQIVRFARNNVQLAGERHGIEGDFWSSEIAGATFSPDGRWLFLNVQHPGFTVAITGPWERGPI
jgi:secreted PhoX family phosphatase